MPSKVWNEITFLLPNFNGSTVEVWEWKSNLISHFRIDVFTYPCGDLSYIISVNEAPGDQQPRMVPRT